MRNPGIGRLVSTSYFGLSDYEVAWSNIAQYQRDYENEKRVYEKDADVVGLEKLSADYNRASEEFTLLEMDLEDSAQKVAFAKRTLEETDARLKRSEDKKLAIEELKRKEARAKRQHHQHEKKPHFTNPAN